MTQSEIHVSRFHLCGTRLIHVKIRSLTAEINCPRRLWFRIAAIKIALRELLERGIAFSIYLQAGQTETFETRDDVSMDELRKQQRK